MEAIVGEIAPSLSVSEWVQGSPTNLKQEKGRIVLVEVIQVNCPGCFLYGIPEAMNMYNKFKDEGVTVLGIATAFEDFDKNTLENLQKLTDKGEVIGETKKALERQGQLQNGRLPYTIPFPLGMDRVTKATGEVSHGQIMQFIYSQVQNFQSQPEYYKKQIIQHATTYLNSKEYSAETFETFGLQGTPSTILVDRKGILRNVSFGQNGYLESIIQRLLRE